MFIPKIIDPRPPFNIKKSEFTDMKAGLHNVFLVDFQQRIDKNRDLLKTR